ncbi:hypothetical protein [Pseudomonas auratipiscis]|uniref:Uncharacterized protein n=1 Tax=Pseudomonas auratipiscis TaxID=3115853 RepID=A0AB35WXZ2_9PSED|nr:MULTISPECIES: hypothetical protein [unclassified Pseudomonas]MEE1866944.1 hypothetical protein [Pseudomonas sp. 120P]MEE1960642.1 hypothetical protein [Pseudomonas sp. 119P]
MAYEVKPFEQGVLMALLSLTHALKQTPGFNEEALTRAAKFFTEVPAGGCESGEAFDAYEWPLSVIQKDVSYIEKLLENKGN